MSKEKDEVTLAALLGARAKAQESIDVMRKVRNGVHGAPRKELREVNDQINALQKKINAADIRIAELKRRLGK